MNFIKEKNNSFFKFIKTNLDMCEEDVEKIEYGMQIIILNVFKIIILFVTAYFLKIFTYTLIAFISFGVLRTFSCGVHADSSIKCIIINYIVFLGNVFLSLKVSLNWTLIMVIFLISLVLVIKYAPADSAERPLVSKKLRKRLKLKSCIAILILCLLSILCSKSIYCNILTFSTLEEALLITPLAYFIFRKPYKNYERVQL